MIAICHRPKSVPSRPRRHSLADAGLAASAPAKPADGRTISRSKPKKTATVRYAAPARVRNLLKAKIEFIDNSSFSRPGAELEILAGPDVPNVQQMGSGVGDVERSISASSTAGYLSHLYQSRLLEPHEEAWLLRKMNFLKYQAHTLRQSLNPKAAELATVQRIEQLLGAARDVQGQIVQANLRLVVSIAKKFVGPACTFEDLVSDGNMSLMRAVEKFNYDRGNRFSTYATYAIRRSLYRLMMKGRQIRSRYVSDDKALQALSEEPPQQQFSPAQVQGLQLSFGRLIERLDPRERQVIVARFGLEGEEPKTFRTLGEELGVCKERIRQLQARALQKLKALGGVELSRLADE